MLNDSEASIPWSYWGPEICRKQILRSRSEWRKGFIVMRR